MWRLAHVRSSAVCLQDTDFLHWVIYIITICINLRRRKNNFSLSIKPNFDAKQTAVENPKNIRIQTCLCSGIEWSFLYLFQSDTILFMQWNRSSDLFSISPNGFTFCHQHTPRYCTSQMDPLYQENNQAILHFRPFLAVCQGQCRICFT